MRVATCLLAAGTALLTASTAHANSGGSGFLTLDGLPPDIVFTEGVPQEIIMTLHARRRPSSTLCHGETFAQITIPEVIEAVYPCYGLAFDGGGPPTPEISGGYCHPGVGDDGAIYPMSGDTFPGGDAQTFDVVLSYDGSAPSTRHGEWRLWSDGKCVDIAPTLMRQAGSVNIHILPPAEAHEDGFVTTSTDPTGVFFLIDHPELNGNPGARFITTPFFQDQTPTSSNHGVFFYWPTEQWAIYREDLTPMPADRDFVVALGGERSLLHTTDSSNTEAFVTYLDDDRINDNPYAAVFVTHNWNPPGGTTAIHDHAVGVYYSPWSGQWMIYNEDQATMPMGVAFNVVVASDWTGGWEEQVGLWPNDAPYMHEDAPSVLQHNYDYPESTYRTDPTSFLSQTGSCLPPPYSYLCWTQEGPASAGGMYWDDTEFFAWSPFPV